MTRTLYTLIFVGLAQRVRETVAFWRRRLGFECCETEVRHFTQRNAYAETTCEASREVRLGYTQEVGHHDDYCLSCDTEQPDTHIESEQR